MIKDIIVNVELKKSRDSVCDYAISVAKSFDAYLAGVAFGGFIDVPNYFMPELPPYVFDEVLNESNQLAVAALERFEAAAKRCALSMECRLDTESNSSPAGNFSAMARCFDLSILMQFDESSGLDNGLLIESTLFDSGRPIIIVPFVQKKGLVLERVICCWDGSNAAARAINDSLPFLKKAAATELFIVTNEKTEGVNGVQGSDMANHLARHGVKVEAAALPGADADVANVILSYAAERAANMIVIGGYGHSRLREFILGGATRGILSAMTVPVFMSH